MAHASLFSPRRCPPFPRLWAHFTPALRNSRRKIAVAFYLGQGGLVSIILTNLFRFRCSQQLDTKIIVQAHSAAHRPVCAKAAFARPPVPASQPAPTTSAGFTFVAVINCAKPVILYGILPGL